MDINFNKNEDHNKLLISDLRKKFAKVKLGGGETRLKKQHDKGKMTARERVDYLLDTGANDVLVVRGDDDSMDRKERLIPFIDRTVLEVNLATRLIRVDWDPEF